MARSRADAALGLLSISAAAGRSAPRVSSVNWAAYQAGTAGTPGGTRSLDPSERVLDQRSSPVVGEHGHPARVQSSPAGGLPRAIRFAVDDDRSAWKVRSRIPPVWRATGIVAITATTEPKW